MSATTRTTAVIDGRTVDLKRGDTILDAAHRAGIDIPTLCHAPGLSPEGGCRMCLVEIDGQRPQAACHTPIAPGMVVRTATDHLKGVRKGLLGLMLSALPTDAAPADARGPKFQRLLAEFGVAPGKPGSAFAPHGSPTPLDDSHPYMRFDRDKCIACRLCLNACEQIQGQFVYAMEGRGGRSRLVFGPTERFADSACVSCGACVDQCPTGAITDRDRLARPTPAQAPDHVAESVCGYCGVGCRVRIESAQGAVLRIRGVEDAVVNHGHLCVKGRYAHRYHRSPERLTKPLLRDKGGTFREVSWSEAIAFAARRLLEIRDRSGPDALGVLTSSRSTNEAAYLLQKMFRSIIGTNNTDCCARVCHSSTAVALSMVTGTGAATASTCDIEEARCIVLAGANPTEAHPVIGARIKQAILKGAVLITIDPREIELARYAAVHLQLWPGTNVALLNALAKVIIDERLFDAAYIGERCEGFETLRAALASHSLDEYAAITRIPAETIRKAARIIAAGPTLFASGLGLSEQTQGVAGVAAYCNLGLLTGSLGKRGAGMLPLRGQNNVQGNADMGAQPYSLTGYMKLDDPAVRERLQRVWGKAPPVEPGKTIPEMFNAAIAGSLKCMWIQGEDVVQSDPNTSHVVKALGALDLLIVQEIFMTDTARMAHIIFPAAAVLEQEGTFTNGERRIQHVRPAVPAPGGPDGARPDWQIIRDVAQAMGGLGAAWTYPSPAAIMDELGLAVPHLFGGVSYDRLGGAGGGGGGEGGDGLQWPCPTKDHPGTRTLHTDRFVRGKAAFAAVEYSPPGDKTAPDYPFVLITGRILEHYNVGTMTRRTPNADLAPRDYLELHAEDADRLGIADGAPVRVKSRFGECTAPAKITRRSAPGTGFLTFHFPETGANHVVGPYTDPISKCPDYKVVAVSLTPV